MRQREKCLQQAELVHRFQRRGVNGVSAKIVQKIGVLLDDHHAHACPDEQIAQHQASRAAPDNTTVSGEDFSRMWLHVGSLSRQYCYDYCVNRGDNATVGR